MFIGNFAFPFKLVYCPHNNFWILPPTPPANHNHPPALQVPPPDRHPAGLIRLTADTHQSQSPDEPRPPLYFSALPQVCLSPVCQDERRGGGRLFSIRSAAQLSLHDLRGSLGLFVSGPGR